jgi:hypothetical protein
LEVWQFKKKPPETTYFSHFSLLEFARDFFFKTHIGQYPQQQQQHEGKRYSRFLPLKSLPEDFK